MAKKGRRGRDDSDDEAPQAKAAAEPQQSSRQALKEKRKARQQRKAAQDSDSDDDVARMMIARMQKGAALSDDEDEPAPVAMPLPKGKGKAKAASAPAPVRGDDSDDGASRKASKASKKAAKASKKKQVAFEDDEDEEPSPRAAKVESDSEDEKEEEEPEPSPKSNGKANKKKGKQSRVVEPEPEAEPEVEMDMDQKDEVEDLAEAVNAVALDEAGGAAKRKMSKAERRAMKKAGKAGAAPEPVIEALTEEDVDDEAAQELATAQDTEAERPKKAKSSKKKKKTDLELMLAAAEEKAAAAAAAATDATPVATSEPVPAASGKSSRASRKQKEEASKKEDDDVEEDTFKDADDQISAQIEEMRRANAGTQFAVSQSAFNENDANWQNALDIIIPNFSISAHNKELFRNAELHIVHGRKYGFVGPNGAGKSTLLKMIASGDLKIPPRIDALYVEQEVVPDDTPAVQAVLRADTRRFALQDEQQRLEEKLEQEEDIDEAVLDRLAEIHDQLSSMGADAAEAHARRILFGLGFDAAMQNQPTKAFSGGWRMRISLAKALYLEPTLLMLDEPTNHLDLNAVIWLDDYLQKWKKTLLIVSHDQDFLNSVCEEVLHLNAKKIDAYKGNYDQFKEMEVQKRKQQQVAWEKQQKKIRALKQSGKSKAQAEATAKNKRESGGAKKKKQSDAIAMGTSNVEAQELIERPREYMVHFEFPDVPTLSPPIIAVNDVAFRYGSKGKMIFNNVNFGLDMDSRVCIVGPNGAGKSTLLKLVTGALQPTTGEINVNARLRMGIYNQHFIDRLPLSEDAVTYIRRLFNIDYQTARNRLGKYGLEGHAHELPMRDLSGGQKARVVLVELSLMAPHMLLLDEPTNNLDIESIDALCDAIRAFNGGVVLVSHDARLIETTDCRLWIVDNQEVTPFEAGFEAYRENILQQLEDQMARQEQEMAAKRAAALALQEKKRADKVTKKR